MDPEAAQRVVDCAPRALDPPEADNPFGVFLPELAQLRWLEELRLDLRCGASGARGGSPPPWVSPPSPFPPEWFQPGAFPALLR